MFLFLKKFCEVAFDRLPCLRVSSLTGSNCKRHRLTRLVYLTIFPKISQNLQTPTRLDLISGIYLEISPKLAQITKVKPRFPKKKLISLMPTCSFPTKRQNSWLLLNLVSMTMTNIMTSIIVWRLLAVRSITVNWCLKRSSYLEEFKPLRTRHRRSHYLNKG